MDYIIILQGGFFQKQNEEHKSEHQSKVFFIRAVLPHACDQLCKGDMSQNSKTAKNGFGAILSRVEFQTGPYKTSHTKYLKNISVYSKQKFVVDTFT